MSDRLEDLYVKGFMAYNAKDFKGAQSFWGQVLSEDPSHEKARQGMAKLKELASKGKKSSKEVFQDIKKLYAAKEFAEALRLTNLLLKKHPDNQDLLGLQQKLSARVQGPDKPASAPEPAFDGRSTMFMASAAELSVADSTPGENDEQQVEKLIQEGVSLYEIQDYEMAIQTWKRALALDPGNRIAAEYVKNVSALIERDAVDQSAPEPDPVPAPRYHAEPEPEPASDKPTKEQMLAIYNEAMALFKDRHYHEALDKWGHILHYYPTHAETLQCVEKTNALLEKEATYQNQMGTARDCIARGSFSQAESILTRLSIEAPHLDQSAIQQELEKARAASALNDRLDDFDDAPPPKEAAQPAPREKVSDDDITSFFNEKTEKTSARKVATATVKKKNTQPVNVFKWIGGIVAVAAVGIGLYLAYDLWWSKRMVKSVDRHPVAVTEFNWNSDVKVVEDFLNFGADFEEESEFMLAAFAYQRVVAIGTPRLEALNKSKTGERTFETEQEMALLRERIGKARTRVEEATRKIRGEQVPADAMALADAEFRRGEYQEAIGHFTSILAADPTNERVRELLGQSHEHLAFAHMKKGDLSSAMASFKKASVLLGGFDTCRRHLEVIQRFFNGTIGETDKNQWFFFFE